MGQGAQALAGRLGGRDGLAYGAALLFGFCMYSSVVNLIPALDAVRPALLTSAIAASALFGRRLFKGEAVGIDGWRGFFMLGVCVLAFASISWSVNPKATQDQAVELLKDFAIYLTLAYAVTNAVRMRWVLGACALGGLAPAWGSFQNYLHGTNLVEGTRARWEGIYLDPNHMAMALVFLVPVAITFLVRGNAVERVLGFVSLFASITGIVVSGSRGGALGLALSVVLWAAYAKNRLRSFSVMGVLVALFLVFSPKSFWNRTDTIADFQQDASALGRVHAWEVGRAISLDKPLLGVGLGGFVYAWPKYAPPDARGNAYVAHNVFLAMIGELGWIGFFLFLFFVSACLTGAFRAGAAPSGGPWIRAVFAGACGYLLCDMSAGYVDSAHFFFICGLLAASERVYRYERSRYATLIGGVEAKAMEEPVLEQGGGATA